MPVESISVINHVEVLVAGLSLEKADRKQEDIEKLIKASSYLHFFEQLRKRNPHELSALLTNLLRAMRVMTVLKGKPLALCGRLD